MTSLKIDAAIRESFRIQQQIAKLLQKEIDRDLQKRKRTVWHYESRVKELESFALKVETGRIASITEVEDVFAATLVVPDATQIEAAVELVLDKYTLQERRPVSNSFTSSSPDSFPFDDLRLYVKYQRVEGEQSGIPDGVVFEVQVKTFLQHAWAVATHDLIYKTELRDWRRERIAHQIRATLEQAEVVIGGIGSLAGTDLLPTTNQTIADLNAVIALLQMEWSAEELPYNIRRVAESVESLLWVVERRRQADRPAILKKLLQDGKARNSGAHSLDWSPYRSVLNYIAQEYPRRLTQRIKDGTARSRLLVYPEVLDALSLSAQDAIGAVVVGA
ncbi:MAG: hypothetical protein Q7L55_06145 [Actinomycetota bacterium]|nr:hypothetical protein [Actinomycetota bacterium]